MDRYIIRKENSATSEPIVLSIVLNITLIYLLFSRQKDNERRCEHRQMASIPLHKSNLTHWGFRSSYSAEYAFLVYWSGSTT